MFSRLPKQNFNKWTKSSQKSPTKKTGMAARVGADDGLQSQHHLLFQVVMIKMIKMMTVMTVMTMMSWISLWIKTRPSNQCLPLFEKLGLFTPKACSRKKSQLYSNIYWNADGENLIVQCWKVHSSGHQVVIFIMWWFWEYYIYWHHYSKSIYIGINAHLTDTWQTTKQRTLVR